MISSFYIVICYYWIHPQAQVKAVVRRYRECEHTDTLSGVYDTFNPHLFFTIILCPDTPAAFRDSFERAAFNRFFPRYIPPSTHTHPSTLSAQSSSTSARTTPTLAPLPVLRMGASENHTIRSKTAQSCVESDVSYDATVTDNTRTGTCHLSSPLPIYTW